MATIKQSDHASTVKLDRENVEREQEPLITAKARLADALATATEAGQWAIASRILAQLEALDGNRRVGAVVELSKRRR